MKARPKLFLSQENIGHDSEVFDYISELHEYLWRAIKAIDPKADGSLKNHLDKSIDLIEERANSNPDLCFFALKKANHELSAIVEDPDSASADLGLWPIELNVADRECLRAALEIIREALMRLARFADIVNADKSE